MPNSRSKTVPSNPGRPGLLAPDFSLNDALAFARRRWKWIATSLVVCVAAGVAYYFLTPPTYESSAQILVMRKDPRLATSGVQTASGDGEAKVSEDLLATHMQMVQSRRIVGEALARNDLDQLPSILQALDDKETPTKYVIENLYVTRGGNAQAKHAHVLNIAFRHDSDSDTKLVLEAVLDRYQEFLSEKFQDVNSEAADLIAQAQKDLAAELQKSEAEYQSFREKAPLLWNGEESTNIHRVEYDQIQSELSTLRLQATDARARLQLVESMLADLDARGASTLERLALIDEKNAERLGILLTVDQGKAQTAQFQASMPDRTAGAQTEFQSLLSLKVREATLRQDFGPGHPEVRNLREQIRETEQFLQNKDVALGTMQDEPLLDPKEIVNAYVKLLKHDLATIQTRERVLEGEAARAEEAAKSLVSFELQNETLRKQVARQQELYDAVVDRLRDINLAKDYGGFINEVIAPVELGEQVWPELPTVIAMSIIMGLVIGSGGAVAREKLDRSFRTSEEVHQALQLPLLSMVPSLTNRKLTAIDGSKVSPVVLAYHQPRSREAEVFRGLRTSLLFDATRRNSHTTAGENGGADKMQVLALSSPNQGDGKSTVSANLAVSIAQTGRSVLLIDGDMRRSRVHELFGVTNGQGLADVLSGKVEPWDVVQATEIDNLSVLPAGASPANPAELLTLSMFDQFLDLARQRYDFVLLDLPPVLAVADPCIVGSHVDAMALIVRIKADSRPQSIRAKEMLISAGANVLGAVVNVCDSIGSFDYGIYGYGYGYGDRYGNANGADHYYTKAQGEGTRQQSHSNGESNKRAPLRT